MNPPNRESPSSNTDLSYPVSYFDPNNVPRLKVYLSITLLENKNVKHFVKSKLSTTFYPHNCTFKINLDKYQSWEEIENGIEFRFVQELEIIVQGDYCFPDGTKEFKIKSIRPNTCAPINRDVPELFQLIRLTPKT